MRFVLDENLPPNLASALELLGQPVVAAARTEARGVPDPELIRLVGAWGGCLISRDRRMLDNPASVAAMKQAGIGLFLMYEGEASALDLARTLLRAWPEILRVEQAEPRFFCMMVHATGTALRPYRVGRGR